MVRPVKSHRLGWMTFAALVSLSGCEQKQEETQEPASAGGAPAKPVLDTKVAAAVNQATRGAETKDVGGPPTTGVLEPGKADAEVRLGAFAKVTVGSAGGEQRFQLGTGYPAPGEHVKFQLEAAHLTGPRAALPTIVYTFDLTTEKPASTGAKAGEGGQPSEEAQAPLQVRGKVEKVELGADQPATIPDEVKQRVAALKGATISYQVDASGARGAVTTQLPEGKEGELEGVFGPAVDALTNLLVSFPKEPIGVGGFWMVTSRERFSYVDVVAYRMYRLEQMEADGALTVSVTTKRYSATNQTLLPNIPPHQLVQFAGEGTGALAVRPGTPMFAEGTVNESLAMALSVQGQDQPAAVQSQSTVIARQVPRK